MMNKKNLYSFPFRFSNDPELLPARFSFCEGPTGFLGLVSIVELYTQDNAPSEVRFFVEVNIGQGTAKESFVPSVTRMTGLFQVIYDATNTAWIIGRSGLVSGKGNILTLHEHLFQDEQEWRQVYEWKGYEIQEDQEYVDPRALLTFWQAEQHFPLLFYRLDAALMSEDEIGWCQWRPATPAQKHFSTILTTSYSCIHHLLDDHCLLFFCRCTPQELEPGRFPFKQAPGEWAIGVLACDVHGNIVHQQTVPHTSLPMESPDLARYDLDRWLNPRMHVTTGPISATGEATCVAALLLQDQVDKWKLLSPRPANHTIPHPSQGGLYWINQNGHILAEEGSPLGEQIRLCWCQDRLVGTDVWEGQRRLWSWSPQSGQGRQMGPALDQQIQGMSVIAVNEQSHVFWCVEEYEDRIRIVQRECKQWSVLQSLECEGLSVLQHYPVRYLMEKQPVVTRCYQSTLLVLCVNQEGVVQLLQFE